MVLNGTLVGAVYIFFITKEEIEEWFEKRREEKWERKFLRTETEDDVLPEAQIEPEVGFLGTVFVFLFALYEGTCPDYVFFDKNKKTEEKE